MLEEGEDKTPEDEVPDFAPIPHNHHECERVIINVGGERFETQLRTLQRFPSTLLGNPTRLLRYYDPVRNEYFLDRNRLAFDAILWYYQSGGMLQKPATVRLDTFCEEIKFYDLGEETILNLKVEEGFLIEEVEPMPFNNFQKEVWLLLEHPETSTQAQVFAVFSVFVICFSIFIFCLETMIPHNRYTLFQFPSNVTFVEEAGTPYFGNPFFVIESMCVGWFTFELILRLLACPDKVAFLKDIMNAVDLIAILPYFLTLYTVLTEDPNEIITKTLDEEEAGLSLANLKVTRLARVFRIFKLSRHSKGLRIIIMTFTASMNEILLLVMLLSVMSVLFSSFVYFAEANNADSFFKSIPDAFWWSVVTMTTVGYGDVTPIGFMGKCVGAACVFSGLITLAIPSPFIETNFMYYYTRESKQDEFITENPNHVESCPFLPDHAKMNLPTSLSGSQLTIDLLLEPEEDKGKGGDTALKTITEEDEAGDSTETGNMPKPTRKRRRRRRVSQAKWYFGGN